MYGDIILYQQQSQWGLFPEKTGGGGGEKAWREKSQKRIQGEFGGHKERKAMCSAVTLTDTSDETETSATPVFCMSLAVAAADVWGF